VFCGILTAFSDAIVTTTLYNGVRYTKSRLVVYGHHRFGQIPTGLPCKLPGLQQQYFCSTDAFPNAQPKSSQH